MGTSRFGLGSRRRRSALLLAGGALLALVAALVLPGRGEGDGPERLTKPQYERAVRVAYADVQAAFAATRVSPDELPERLEAAEASLRRAAAALGRVRPPAEVAADHARLVAGLAAYAAELDRLDGRVPTGTSEAVEEIAEAAERMKFKRYDLGRIAQD